MLNRRDFILHSRLGCLMFLQYFMMGSWFVPFGSYMSKYLKFDDIIGLAYGSQGIATIVSALLVGLLADRVFSTERLLSALFFLSALTIFLVSFIRHSETLFLFMVFIHFVVFIPTIPLSNSLCFRWLSSPVTQFPLIRAIGTIGWIVSGLMIGTMAGAAETRIPLLVAATAGGVLALYSLTLPHTVPLGDNQIKTSNVFNLAALVRQADRSFWVLIGATLLIMIPMAFYYAYCNNFLLEAGATATLFGTRFEATALQSLGQISELAFLLLLPFFLRRVSIKGVFLLGIASWIVRYLLFAAAWRSGNSVQWMLVMGVLLHGAANDFIQVAGQVYVNQSFAAQTRTQAQALFTTALMGVGAIVGSTIANIVYAHASVSAVDHDWRLIWLIPAIAASGTFLWFAAGFSPRRTDSRIS